MTCDSLKRMPRSAYWFRLIILALCVWGVEELALCFAAEGGAAYQPFFSPFYYIILFSVLGWFLIFCASRLRDMGFSGWWAGLMLVPFLNLAIGLFWLGMVKGTDGGNRYGDDPLEINLPAG